MILVMGLCVLLGGIAGVCGALWLGWSALGVAAAFVVGELVGAYIFALLIQRRV